MMKHLKLYSKYFSHKLFKIIQYKEMLIDIRKTDVQEKIIKRYHEKKEIRGKN